MAGTAIQVTDMSNFNRAIKGSITDVVELCQRLQSYIAYLNSK